MSDSRPGHDRPAEHVPPPPPAPPGAGPNDPWAPGSPQERPPAGYGAPAEPGTGPYGGTAPAPQNGMGTASLVLGIVGLVFAVLFFPLGFLLAATGLVLGIIGLKRAGRGLATNRGMATAGTALSVLALLVCIGWGVVIGLLVSKTSDCNDPDLSRTEQRQCVEDKLGSLHS